MPTKKPRLTITINERLAWQLQQLSRLTGQSQGGIIGSLLEGSDLVLHRLIVVLEAAQEAKDSIPGQLTSVMGEAQERIERHFGLVQPVDTSVQRRARKTSAVAQRATASAGSADPLSNRGGRSGAERAKKPTKSRG